MIPQPAAEVRAVEVIRDEVHLLPVDADVVHRHDAWVAHLGEPTGLLEQALRLGLLYLARLLRALIATSLSSCVSWHRYTAPKPPAPKVLRTT